MPLTDFSAVSFRVADGQLIMTAVARTTGRPYRHACNLASYESVARAIEEAGSAGLTREDLHEKTGLPWTRINVALLFLYERSIIERAGKRGRLSVPATTTVYEDAMTEYSALAEKGGQP